MLTALFCIFLGWVFKCLGLMTLLGLGTTTYYLVFFFFGLVVHLINMITRE